MIKVAFLLDRSNDWLAAYLPTNVGNLSRFEFHEVYDEEKVRGFDIVFLLGYTKIVKGEILSSNKLLLVVHESDLPKGKGFAPVQWQILEGVNEIKISLLEVGEKVDSGAMIEQLQLLFNGKELYDEIRSKQANATFELISRFLAKYPEFSTSQQMGKSTLYRKRTPEDSELDIDKTIRDQFQLLRVCNNESWPAFFLLDGTRYTLKIYNDN